ncbi:MAG: hypothetical protein AAF591_20990 [Verrucomicrobiota bacterium]
MRWVEVIFAGVCVTAGVVPFFVGGAHGARGLGDDAFTGWPESFEGRNLVQYDLSEREAAFAESFPGKVGLFGSDGEAGMGEKRVIMRWVQVPTRRLHSSGDCLRAMGYAIEPGKIMRDGRGQRWATFLARKDGSVMKVRERFYTAKGGEEWTDVSAWFWAAAMGRTEGPWWGVTVVE